MKALEDLQQATRISGLVLDEEAQQAIEEFNKDMGKARAPGIPEVGPEAVAIMLGAFTKARALVEQAAKRDLWQ